MSDVHAHVRVLRVPQFHDGDAHAEDLAISRAGDLVAQVVSAVRPGSWLLAEVLDGHTGVVLHGVARRVAARLGVAADLPVEGCVRLCKRQ